MAASTVVIPCFNEAHRLSVEALGTFIDSWPQGHLLMVDDGSTDETYTMLEALSRKYPRISAMRLGKNGGKGEAVRQGMLAACQRGSDFVGYWDADLATPLEMIPEFEKILQEQPGLDIVIGSRVRLLGRSVERRAVRHYVGRVFGTAASMVLGVAVYDTQCGAKLFRATERISQILAAPFQSRWIFDVELLARYLDGGGPGEGDRSQRIYELPLTVWKDVQGSKLKGLDFARAALDLVSIAQRRRRS
jgi:dolichyl-phosphate beta-glucosyltransferase